MGGRLWLIYGALLRLARANTRAVHSPEGRQSHGWFGASIQNVIDTAYERRSLRGEESYQLCHFLRPPWATDETFLIESGEIEVNLGGELLRGRSGDAIYLPKGIPHAPRVMGNDDLTVGEPELPLLVKLAPEYGIEFQFGPPS